MSADWKSASLLDLIYLYLHEALRSENTHVSSFKQSLKVIFHSAIVFKDISKRILRVITNSKHLYKLKTTTQENYLLYNTEVFADFASSSHLSRFLLSIFAQASLRHSQSGRKMQIGEKALDQMFDRLAWMADLLGYESLANRTIVKSFLCSQNFNLLVKILAVFEGIFSGKKEYLLSKNKYYPVYTNYECLLLDFTDLFYYFAIALNQLKNLDHIELAKQQVGDAVLIGEWLSQRLDRTSKRARSSRWRLNITQKLHSILAFLTTFTRLDQKKLSLTKQSYTVGKGSGNHVQSSDSNDLLTSVLDNLFCQIETAVEQRDTDLNRISNVFGIFDMSVVNVKCIIEQRPELHNVPAEYIINRLSHILLDKFQKPGKADTVKRLFELLYRIYLDDFVLEKYFICLGFGMLSLSKPGVSKKSVERILFQCESVMALSKAHVQLDSCLGFTDFVEDVTVNVFNSKNNKSTYLFVKHVLMEQFSAYDEKTLKLNALGNHSQTGQIVLHENLYIFDADKIEKILENNNDCSRLSEKTARIHVPSSKLGGQRFSSFMEYLIPKILSLFESFESVILNKRRRKFTSQALIQSQNDYAQNMQLVAQEIQALAKMAGQSKSQCKLISAFFKTQQALYKHNPHALKTINSLQTDQDKDAAPKWHTPKLAPSLTSCADKAFLKKRQKRLLTKIYAKMGKCTEQAKTRRPLAKCMVCHEAFSSASESFLIAKFQETSNESLITGCHRGNPKFRVVSSCGHYYHYECLPISKYYSGLRCHFCKAKGQFFMGGRLLPSSTVGGGQPAPQQPVDRSTQYYKLLIQLTVLKEHPQNPEMDLFDKLVMPIIEPIRMINTFKLSVFRRGFLPCLQRLMNLLHNMLAADTENANSLVQLSKSYLKQAIRDYPSFGNCAELSRAFCPQEPKYRECVEELLVKVFVCSYLISVDGAVKSASKNRSSLDMTGMASRCLDQVLAEIVPWLFQLKKLQNGPRRHRQLPRFSDISKLYPDFVKVLNVLCCVVRFDDDLKITRKKSWNNLHGRLPARVIRKVSSASGFCPNSNRHSSASQNSNPNVTAKIP